MSSQKSSGNNPLFQQGHIKELPTAPGSPSGDRAPEDSQTPDQTQGSDDQQAQQ